MGLNGIKLDLNKFDMTRRFHFFSFLEIHGAVKIFKIERFGNFKTGVSLGNTEVPTLMIIEEAQTRFEPRL